MSEECDAICEMCGVLVKAKDVQRATVLDTDDVIYLCPICFTQGREAMEAITFAENSDA